MKKLLLIITLLPVWAFSQNTIQDAWIYFSNKPEANNFIENPLTMLSQKALDRRIKQGISLDEKDAPIHASYYNEIKNTTGIQILAKSKWMNALHIQGTFEVISNLENKNFVSHIEFADKTLNSSGVSSRVKKNSKTFDASKKLETTENYNYGNATNQIEMLGGEKLHELGYTGSEMTIAVIDAGFPNVNNLDAFAYLRDNNKILGGYNFVNNSENFYMGNSHGTLVLSDIAGNVSNEFVGTAPNASFYLFITEDASQEMPIEESNWVQAVERADSLGVDVINTSLGYTEYDNPNYSYIYADMNGQTAFASRAADIAFSRGMILVTSAGNSGNDAWHYIGVPADAKNVFTIGAVDPNRNIANFSSFGPTSDGRIKPDVCAEGRNVYVIDAIGQIKTSNGTSFSSPVLCGVVACLWEAFPDKTNLEIMDLLRKSAHLYNNPTDQEGYGIPNITKILEENEIIQNTDLTIYPNPVKDYLKIKSASSQVDIKIFNVLGKKIMDKKFTNTPNGINLDILTSGIYIVRITDEKNKTTRKIIKE
ncbi:S8 family serine peptidase [Aureivirga marina]|uniref:S8 family serine peptidase n=1 Tax=Aureivirga marina TaxID=1182451 RepID=UPI0018C96EE3|nr:S8 family serine peptidase [Aureivirga marina]